MRPLQRLHEKLADRFSFIQYPNVRPADQTTRQASRTGLRFKHAMPIGKRIDLFLMSTLLLMIGIAASAAVLFFLYAFLF